MGMCVLNPSTWTSGEEVCSSDVFQLSRFATSRKEMCIAHTLHCNQRVVQQKERTTWVVLQVVSIICGHPPPRHSMYAIFACTVWGGARGGSMGRHVWHTWRATMRYLLPRRKHRLPLVKDQHLQIGGSLASVPEPPPHAAWLR